MKKLLTIALAAIAATAINAATVNWGGSTDDASNTDGYTGNGTETSVDYEGYAPAGSIYTLIYLGDTYTGSTSASKYDKDTGLTDLGGTVKKTHTLSADEADFGTWEDTLNSDNYDASGKSDLNGFYMVVFYNSITDKADASAVFEVSGLTQQSSSDNTLMSLDVGFNAGSVSVVPEPTSAMLIALGLAALGLKRKVA